MTAFPEGGYCRRDPERLSSSSSATFSSIVPTDAELKENPGIMMLDAECKM